MAPSFGSRALAAAGLCMLRVSGAAAACATNNVNSPATGGFKSMVCPADTSVPHTPKCLLVLPGKGNNHDGFTLFQETAARMGYSAFSIQYQASPDTFSQCHVDYNDLDCSLKVRTAKQEVCLSDTTAHHARHTRHTMCIPACTASDWRLGGSRGRGAGCWRGRRRGRPRWLRAAAAAARAWPWVQARPEPCACL